MGLNSAGLGFTFSARDSGVGNFFAGLKSSVVSAGKQLGDFAAQASSSTSSLGTSGAALKNVNSELVVFDRAAFNAARMAGDFTDGLSPERIDPGRDSMGRFTKHLYGFSKASDKAGKEFEGTSDAITSGSNAGAAALGAMGDMAGKLGDILGQLKLGNFMAAFDMKGLGAVKEALSGLTQGGGELTSSFESQAAGVSKSSRSIAANMGLSGKELREFQTDYANLVTGQEIGEEAAKKALKAWKTNAEDFKAIGLMDKSQVAKFAEMGVNVDQLSDSLRKAKKTFGFADEDLKALTGSAAAFGKQTGDVSSAMNTLPALMEQLGQVTDGMGNKLKGAELAKFGQGTLAVAAGLVQTGSSAEEAMKRSQALSAALIGGRKEFGELFTGANQEFPKLIESLSIATGSSQDAFALMNSGPDGFMKVMAEMTQGIRASGGDTSHEFRMMRDHIVKAMGEEAGGGIVDFMQTADDATLATMAATKTAIVDLGKMAKESHQGTRTLADSMKMAEDQFITSFRNIGRKGAQKFVADTGKAFGEFTVKMNKVAAGDGPLAGIVNKFSEVHQMGAKALLPEALRPIATIMGTMGKEIVPLLGVLGSMGLKFSMLASPIALLAVPIAILVIRFADLMMRGKSVGEAFEQIGQDILGFAGNVVHWAGKALDSLLGFVTGWFQASKKLDFTAFFSNLLGGLKGGGKGMGPALAEFGADLVQGIGDALSGRDPKTKSKLAGVISNLIGAIANTFKALVKGMDASGLGDGIIDFLKKGFLFALEAPNKIFGSIDWKKVVGTALGYLGVAFDALSDPAVGGFMGSIGAALGRRVNLLGGILLEVVGGALDWLSKADLSGWIIGILNNVLSLAMSLVSAQGDLVGQLLSKIPEWWPKVHKTILGLLSELPGMLGETLSGLGPTIGPIFTKVFKAAIIAVGNLIRNSPEMFMAVVEAIPQILSGLKTLLFGAFDLLKSMVLGIGKGIMEGLVALFPAYAGPITAVFDGIVNVISGHFNRLKITFRVVFAILKFGFEVVVKIVKAVWEGVKILWEQLMIQFELLKTVASAVWDAISVAATFVFGVIQEGWTILSGFISNVMIEMQGAWEVYTGLVTTVWGTIWGTISGVITAIQEAVAGVIGFFSTGWSGLVTWLSGLWSRFATWFTNLWPGAASVIGKVWGWISATIGAVWDGIKSAGQSVATGMSNVWKSLMSGIKGVYDTIIDTVNAIKTALAAVSGEEAVLVEKMDVTPAEDTMSGFTDDANKAVEIEPFVLSADASEANAALEGFGDFKLPAAPTLTSPSATGFTTGMSASQMGPVPGVPPAHWEQDSAKAIASYTAVVNAASVMRTGLNTTYTGISTDSAAAFKVANVAIDKLMTEGLVGTFKKTWKTVLAALPKEFFEPYMKSWKAWVDELVKYLGEGIIRMLQAMAVATTAMQTDVGTIVAEVNQITAAVGALMAMKAKAAEEEKQQDAAELVNEEGQKLELSADLKLLEFAVNNPTWYDDYSKNFHNRMQELIAAVKAGAGKQAASTPAGASAKAAEKTVRGLTGSIATKSKV